MGPCHASQRHADAAVQLADRLNAARPGLHLLLTARPDAGPRETPAGNVVLTAPPDDTAAAAHAFLDHWRPDVCLWCGGELRGPRFWAPRVGGASRSAWWMPMTPTCRRPAPAGCRIPPGRRSGASR